ncbi:hypothetical protein ACSBR1_016394 [Camellia fascicularis]
MHNQCTTSSAPTQPTHFHLHTREREREREREKMRKTNQSKRRINGGKAVKIEEKGFGKWESLDKKLMLDIFNRLEPAFLLTTVAWVCRSWGRACYDRFFAEKGEQNTLNLRALHSMSFWSIRINFTKLLRGVMDVYACDNDDDYDDDGGVRVRVTPITKIMFPSEFVTVTDDHLVYAAKRMCHFEESHNVHDPMIGKYKHWSITRRLIPRKRRSALRSLSYTNLSLTCTAPIFNSYSLALMI